ncbi:MAG: M20/M25/M40 family metallo-hydrolase [Bacteroidales bacterium]|nr:M20/M25/M40 family metallo-hydrolase [Bacteroidales bacterium]
MKLRKFFPVLFIISLLPLTAKSQSENVDLSMVYKIKQEGLKNSSIEELAFGLTDFTGPRLTCSDGNIRGNEWAKKKMEELGFQNVRIEAAGELPSGGWDNLKTYAAMTAPYYASFACNPVAWTGSTHGAIKSQLVLIDVKAESDLEKYKGTLAGKIVLLPSSITYEPSFEPLASRYTDEKLKELSMASGQPRGRRQNSDFSTYMAQRALQQKIREFLNTEGAALILNGAGTFNVPKSAGAKYTAGSPEPVAELNLAVEAHGRMERLLRHNIPVEMEVEIINKFSRSTTVYNVIGELPGTDKLLKNEVVMVGAHIDSWHGGTGAADNASGCIVMMEALRILKSLEVAPRRTIRVVLWGGEEQGYYGSKGYIEKYLANAETKEHKADYDKFAAYFNMDNGSGKYRGIYIQENEMVRPIFEEWLKPFADMGASTITIRNTSGTDHIPFNSIGLPGFQFIQDEIEYGRGYHTTMDTYERLVMADLKQNAVITASFVYNAAMRSAKLPAKPVIKSLEAAEKNKMQ